VAGHVGLELRNVAANYPFESSHRFPGSIRSADGPSGTQLYIAHNSGMSLQIFPLKGPQDLRGSSRNSGHRDYSRLSYSIGETQLGPNARISAKRSCGRWSMPGSRNGLNFLPIQR
jgi:hypothetical protein